MIWTIHIDDERRRLWTIGPVPLSCLETVCTLARDVCRGDDVVVNTVVAQRLGASMAFCARDDSAAWRDER